MCRNAVIVSLSVRTYRSSAFCHCRCAPAFGGSMQICYASNGAYWCKVAVLFLTLCMMKRGSAISFEEFVGYPFNEANGYSIFPRGIDHTEGLPIPVPFPYFGRTFLYANVSVCNAHATACLHSYHQKYLVEGSGRRNRVHVPKLQGNLRFQKGVLIKCSSAKFEGNIYCV